MAATAGPGSIWARGQCTPCSNSLSTNADRNACPAPRMAAKSIPAATAARAGSLIPRRQEARRSTRSRAADRGDLGRRLLRRYAPRNDAISLSLRPRPAWRAVPGEAISATLTEAAGVVLPDARLQLQIRARGIRLEPIARTFLAGWVPQIGKAPHMGEEVVQ